MDVERVNEQLSSIKGEALHFNALAFKEIKNLQGLSLCTACCSIAVRVVV